MKILLMNKNYMLDKKNFLEKKILDWEDARYNKTYNKLNFFEKLVNSTNETLIFRLKITFEHLKPHFKNKKIIEIGCGSGLLAEEIIAAGALSYTGYDFSEKAVAKGNAIAKDKKLDNKVNFFAKSVNELEILDADIIFSLGLTDWLSDEEIKRLFYISQKAENLHSISEKRKSIGQMLHRLYVFLSYGRKSGGYSPRYLDAKLISNLISIVTKKNVYKYNHKKMSFGLLLSTIKFNNSNLNNIDER